MARRGQASPLGRPPALDPGPLQLVGLVAEPDLPVGDSRCYHAIHGLLHLSLLPEELQAANQILRLVEHGYHGLSVLHLSGIFTVQLQ